MTAPLRVALLTASPGWRGSSASFAKIGLGLAARGHAPMMVTQSARLSERFAALGLSVTELALPTTGLREAWRLRAALRGMRADLVVADTPRDLRLAVLATAVPGRAARVVYRYNLGTGPPRGDLGDRAYFSRVALVLFQSRFAAEQAFARVPWLRRTPAVRIPNGYDTAVFAPDAGSGRRFRQALGLGPAARVVLTPANLGRDKGQDTLLDALGILRRRGVEATCVLVGHGEREQALRARALELGVPAVFTGFLAPERIPAALNAADVLVHLSAREMFPNAVGEAMACGRPIVATNAGGTAELLGDDGTTGVLVPVGDSGAVAAAIERLLANEGAAAALGRAARARIEREFPVERMQHAYTAVLAATAAGATAPLPGATDGVTKLSPAPSR